MIKRLFCVLAFPFVIFQSQAQQLPIGSWRTYMPYNQGLEVIEVKGKIYCAGLYGLYNFDKSDNSINVITKIDGLSDVRITAFAYDETTDAFVIGYENTNIDILKSGEVINFRGILDKDIMGIKMINSIEIHESIAYINCGFGTVLYDLKREEVRDTYILGAGGANMPIYSMAIKDSLIYAATDSGILQAPLSGLNLADFQNWSRHTLAIQGFPPGLIPHELNVFNQMLYTRIGDKIYRYYQDSIWELDPILTQFGNVSMKPYEDKIMLVKMYGVEIFDTQFQSAGYYYTPNFVNSIRSGLIDKEGGIWIADVTSGLMKVISPSEAESYMPAGPFDLPARRLSFFQNKLLVAPSPIGDRYLNRYNFSGFYLYDNYDWKNINYSNSPGMDTTFDIVVSAFNPRNGRYYLGTFGRGILEFADTQRLNTFTYLNSTIGEAYGNPGNYRVTGIAFDSKNNMWVSNHWAAKPISVRKTNGQWESFEFPGVFTELKYVADITIDRFDQKWVVLPEINAILVFKENANGTVTYKKLTVGVGRGNLPDESSQVFCITEDLDGKIWVGTNKGVVVYYNPGNILNPGADIDAQPVKVIDGEFVQSLLGNESVTVIKVDGANRKWIGTRSGIWLFSADGTKQIHYFNTQNSPLLSNSINDIAIDPVSGEVYFATDNGIISYRGDATEGGITHSNVKVFPNPVSENYSGLIAIQGLVLNANVKITDINGAVVYQTIANGGQATWNGHNFNREKVSSGVYLVFSTDDSGNETMVNKIMFIR